MTDLPFVDSLLPFQEILAGYDPRFLPSEVFLKRILSEFADRDLVLEAEAMIDWLRHHRRRKLSPAFVFGWLKRAPVVAPRRASLFACGCGIIYATRSEAVACSLNHPSVSTPDIKELPGAGERGGYLVRRIAKGPDGKWGPR